MPRGDRLLFKYVGDGDQRHHGIPMRDLYESDRGALTDEHLVTLGASAIYRPRNDADEEVAAAEQRVEPPADDVPTVEPLPGVVADAVTVPADDMPAPKGKR